MASTDNSTPLPYQPANPPFTERTGELSRATWDELYRIAERFQSSDKPASMSTTSIKSCPVQSATVWTRLFNVGVTYEWQEPGGQLDTTTGIWTCPQEGLYAVTIVLEIPAFAQTGANLYSATLRTTGHPANGSPDVERFSRAGGPDEAPLRFVVDFLRPLNRGDQVWFDLDLTEATFTGNVSVFSVLNICRQGSAK